MVEVFVAGRRAEGQEGSAKRERLRTRALMKNNAWKKSARKRAQEKRLEKERLEK